jgi:hypothetical protein
MRLFTGASYAADEFNLQSFQIHHMGFEKLFVNIILSIKSHLKPSAIFTSRQSFKIKQIHFFKHLA